MQKTAHAPRHAFGRLSRRPSARAGSAGHLGSSRSISAGLSARSHALTSHAPSHT